MWQHSHYPDEYMKGQRWANVKCHPYIEASDLRGNVTVDYRCVRHISCAETDVQELIFRAFQGLRSALKADH